MGYLPHFFYHASHLNWGYVDSKNHTHHRANCNQQAISVRLGVFGEHISLVLLLLRRERWLDQETEHGITLPFQIVG